MSIKRINEFPEGSGSLSSDDIFLFMDSPSASGVTKKISLSELSSFINTGSTNIFQISSVDLHNGGVQTAQVLQFDDNSKQSVITGPTPPSGTDSQRIILQGQRAEGNGEGGDVYVWGGDADEDGGDIKIYAGDADNVAPDSGYGGYVRIDGGKGASEGGNVEITGGESEGGQAGDVIIAGGSTSSGVAGDVNINSNNGSSWVFSPDSSLTLPHGSIITDDVETVTLSGAGTSAVNQTYRRIQSGQYVGITDNSYQIDPQEAPSTGYLVRLTSAFPPTGYYESEDLITWTIVAGEGGGVSPVPTSVVAVANITLAVDTSNWIFGGDGSLTLPASGGFIFPDNTTQTSAGIPSNTGLVPNSTSIANIVSISQANYDALGTKDPNTLYVIQ